MPTSIPAAALAAPKDTSPKAAARVAEPEDILGEGESHSPDELLVKFKNGVKDKEKDALIEAKKAKKKEKIKGIDVYVISLAKGSDEAKVARELENDKRVEFAEPNGIVKTMIAPSDPYFDSPGSWGQAYKDLWGVHRIKAPEAWDITTGSDDVIIAVSDTGLDFTHEDIQGNVYANPGESGTDSQGRDKRTNGVDDDGNGRTDDWRGWDFANGDNNPTDDHGHGTHCAGTIAAATDNGKGIAGVAWNASILPVKFLNSGGSGDMGQGAASIVYAADMGAKVVSCSWGGIGTNLTVQAAVDYARSKGTAVIAAAGNDGVDAKLSNPANCVGVITVAATQYGDTKASFSNYGEVVEVAAPGVDTLSLQAAGTNLGTPRFPGYTTASGTSMATPHVSGIAALLFSLAPDLTVDELEGLLVAGSEKVSALSGVCASGGVVSAHGSLDLARRPRMRSSSPAIGERQVALDTSIAVEFSCPIEPGPRFGDIALRIGDIVLDATVEIDGERLTVTPAAPFEDNMRPVLTIPAGAVASLTGFETYRDYEVSFFTPDDTAPVAVSATPTDGATGVSPLAPVTIVFDEDVAAAGEWNAITVSTGGNAVAITRKAEGERLIIESASGMWAASTAYTVTIPAGAVKDLDGNSSTVPFSFTFTTGIGTVRVEESSPMVEYSAPWLASVKPGHSGGTARWTATPGDSASVTFTGTEVSVLFCAMSMAGPARVYVNDVLRQEINTYSPYYRYQRRLFIAPDLPPDTYTIRVEVGGTGNTAVMLDAFDIRPAIDITPPPVLEGVEARAANESRIDVSWDAPPVPDVAGYHVYRSLTAGGPYEKLTSGPMTGTRYRDTDIQTGTTYYYVMTAVDTTGNEGAHSSEVSATPASDTESPSAPAGLDAHAVFEGPQVALWWQASTDDFVVDGYEVERSADGGITWTQIATAEGPIYTDAAVLRGTAYRYRVRALDCSGNRSVYSESLAVGVPDLRIEENEPAVTYAGQWYTGYNASHSGGAMRLASAAGSSATLTFIGTQASVVFETGLDDGIAHVYVDEVLQRDVDTYSRTKGYRKTLFTVRDLTPGIHTLRVEVAGVCNPAGYTNWVCIDAFDVVASPPPPPSGLGAVVVGSRAVDLSWSALNVVGIAGYNAYRSMTPGGPYEKINDSLLTSTTYRDSGLETGTTYHYVVTAVETMGHESEYSSAASVTPMLDAEAPSMPAGFDAGSGFESDVISLFWQPSTDDVFLEGYELERSGDGGTTWARITTTAATTYTDMAVLRGIAYRYRVRAYDASDNRSGYSELAIGVPDLRVEENDPTVTYAGYWGSVLQAQCSGGSMRRGYSPGDFAALTFIGTQASVVFACTGDSGIARVYVDDVLHKEVDTYSGSWQPRQALFTVRDLVPGMHTIRVEVMGTRNPASGGQWIWLDAFDVVGSPPPAPSGFRVAAASGSAVDLSWNRVNAAGIAGYNVYRSTVAGRLYERVNASLLTATAYRDSSLETGTTYHYVVTTVDAAGREGIYSDELSATPASDTEPPSVPLGFDAHPSFEGPQVSLSWQASTDDFVVDGYEVERSADGGVTWAQIAVSSATAYDDTAVLRGTAYRYRTRAYDASGNRSEYAGLGVSVPDLWVEDDDPAVAYATYWHPSGGAHWASSAGHSATLTFRGTQVSPVFGVGPGRGSVRVYVDEVLRDEVDTSLEARCTVADLTPGLHTVRIETISGGVELDAFEVVSSTPPAPSQLHADVASADAIDLSWSSVSEPGVAGYNIYRSTDQTGLRERVNESPITGTHYRDHGLQTAVTHFYAVTTVSVAGKESTHSVQASATPALDTEPPSVPFNLEAHPAFEAPQVSLSWQASMDDFVVDGYEVERSADGGVTWAQIAVTSATSHTDTAVLRGAAYRYRVRANDASGNRSGYAEPITVGVPDLRVEESDPAVTYVGEWWSDNGTRSAYEAGSAATLTFSGTQASVVFQTTPYCGIARIYVDGVFTQEVDTQFAIWGTQQTLFTVRDLAPDTHTLKVEVTGGWNPPLGGQWIYIDAFDVVMAEDVTPPPAPAGLGAAISTNPHHIALDWSPVAALDVVGYNVYRSTTSGSGYVKLNETPLATPGYGDSAVVENTTYAYVVTAVDAGGNESAYSGEVPAIIDTLAPSAPPVFQATAASETRISLYWTGATDNVGVTGYRIEYALSGTGLWAEMGTSATSTFNGDGLSPWTAYDFRVLALDAAGNVSLPSHVITITMCDLTAPTAPSDLQATAASETGVSLSWTAASDNVGVTGYRMERAFAGSGIWTEMGTSANNTFNGDGLSPWTAYDFRVVAVDAAGNESAASDVITVTTPDTTAPSAPVVFQATAASETRISLYWTAALDNVGVTGYRIERAFAGTGLWTEMGTSATNTFNGDGLSSWTAYDFRVLALDAAGNASLPSYVITITMCDLTAPSAPSVSSSTHPIQETWYANAAPVLDFSATDVSGISGYSYVLDEDTATVPDEVSEGAGTSKSYSALADGEYYFHVRALDGAGNWGETAHYRVRVNTTPPPSNIAPGKAFSGSSQYSTTYAPAKAGDGSASTSWRSVALSSSTKTQWLQVDLGAATTINKVVVNWSGTNFATAYQLQTSADGVNWTTRYSTAAGTAGSKTHTFPTVNARYVRLYCTNYNSKTGYWVNELEVWRAASGSFTLAGGAAYTSQTLVTARSFVPGAVSMSFDSGSGFSTSVPYAANASVRFDTGDGVKTVSARYTDSMGAELLTLSDTIVLDTSGPAAPTVSSSTHPDQGAWYAGNSPVFSFIASDTSGISGYSYVLDQSPSTVPGPVSQGSATSKSYSSLADGEYYFHVLACDGVGNWGVTAHYRIHIDATAPSGTMGVAGGADTVRTTAVSVDSDVTGASEMRIDTGAGYGAWSPYLPNTQAVLPDVNGSHTVRAQYRDPAGNTLTLSDTVAYLRYGPGVPSVTSTTHPNPDTWYANANPVLSFIATDAAGISGYSYLLDQVATSTPDATSEGTTTVKAYSSLAGGEYYFHVRGRNGAGEWGGATHFRIRVTTAPPSYNVARGKTFTASSQFSSTYTPARAGDGSVATAWRTVALTSSTKTQWLRVDLGAATSVNKVVVNWSGTCFATAYQVQTSTDGANWTTQYSTTAGTAGINTHTFSAVSARYVRLYCTAYSSKTGYWVNELEAWTP